MSDVNLIPADYRLQQNMRKVLQRFLAGFAVLVLMLLAARIGLGIVFNMEKTRAEKLKTGEILIGEKKKEFATLTAKKNDLQLRLDMLEHLRGGPPAKEMFITIDEAINDAVWFTKLNFTRTDPESGSSQAGRSTGYFIVVPQGSAESSQQVAGLNSGLITISGMALTHSSLAEFVNLLVAQPQIQTVQVRNTHSRKYLETSAVEYELSAVMVSDITKK